MMILGPNMITAIANATRPNTNTALAAVSLATLAMGCFLSVIKSTTASMLVLISSVAITKPIIRNRINHSVVCLLYTSDAADD